MKQVVRYSTGKGGEDSSSLKESAQKVLSLFQKYYGNELKTGDDTGMWLLSLALRSSIDESFI